MGGTRRKRQETSNKENQDLQSAIRRKRRTNFQPEERIAAITVHVLAKDAIDGRRRGRRRGEAGRSRGVINDAGLSLSIVSSGRGSARRRSGVARCGPAGCDGAISARSGSWRTEPNRRRDDRQASLHYWSLFHDVLVSRFERVRRPPMEQRCE